MHRLTTVATLILTLAAFSTAGRALPPAGPLAGTGQTIDACGTISQSGSYRLTTNLTASGDCLIIAASFVRVDLGGFTLTGDGTGSGIKLVDPALDLQGVDLRRGTIRQFETGVDLSGAQFSRMEEIRALFNTGDGIRIGASSVIERNVSRDNGGVGFFTPGGSKLVRNDAAFNASHGFHGGVVLLENTSRRNGGDGIHSVGSGLVIRGNSVDSNDGSGIVMGIGVARENVSLGNDGDGIRAACPTSLVGNSVSANGGVPISTSGAGCVLSDNATD
jgi:hypothetical protein